MQTDLRNVTHRVGCSNHAKYEKVLLSSKTGHGAVVFQLFET